MIGRIAPVEASRASRPSPASVRRTDYIPDARDRRDLGRWRPTTGCSRRSAARSPTGATSTRRWSATRRSSSAASRRSRLGIDDAGDGVMVDIGGHWFVVVGILEPLPLAPEIDRSALIGLPIAKELFGATGSPTTIYVRAADAAIDDVRVGPAGDGEPGEPGGGRGQPAVRGRSRRRPRPRRRSPRCSSALGRWRCSSAASASPT